MGRKKHLTKQEEFDIMKLVLDKFLWLGVIIMAFGFYRLLSFNTGFWYNFGILFAGVVVMVLFMIIIIKEYEFIKD
ncbi:MAG: hypothetical protein V1659_00825 [Candidatus Woesearchaeota archaeon]